MIVRLNYEELRALRSGARALLGRDIGAPSSLVVLPERRALLEALEPHLEGDVSLATLAELRGVEQAVDAIVGCLRAEMEAAVAAAHPADELAVAAYFDFAHALAVARRLEAVAGEMEAVIELVTGTAPDADVARTFRFPD